MMPRNIEPDPARLFLTELEARLAQPDGEALKQTYLARLELRSTQLKIDLRQLLSPKDHLQLTALLEATDAAHRVLTAWPTGGKQQNLPDGQTYHHPFHPSHRF